MLINTESLQNLAACPDCDLLMPKYEIPVQHTLHCPRCGKKIYKRVKNSLSKVLALSISGLLLYLPAILLPLMTLKSLGFADSANILESVINFYNNGYYFVSLMVLFSAIIFPCILLSLIFIISINLHRKKYPTSLKKLFRTYLHIEEWAMVEVYLLGIMITIIKMQDTADIYYHSGIFCFAILVLTTLTISTTIDKPLFWQLIQDSGQKVTKDSSIPTLPPSTTAAHLGLTLCNSCHQLNKTSDGSPCSRCGETLHERIHQSSSKTWALVLTSAIFLIPANVFPIMRVDFLGIADKSTILDGIIYFFHDGSYFIGIIIFSASILVPLFKILGLFILLITKEPCSYKRLKQKTQMYRFIAFIGRWSMLDIFVIALLTVLVDFGFFTSIHAAPAATYFCIVVASTMFAAITFDPRLLWDKCFARSSPVRKIVSSIPTRPNHD